MRIECEHCRRLVNVDRFRASRAGIDVLCPACEQTFHVPAEPPPLRSSGAASPAPPAGPAMRCPKCGDEQPEAIACRRCGLAAEHFASFATEATEDVPGEVALGWRRCLSRWGAPDVHDEFAELVVAAGAFAFAARQYRERLREHPDDGIAKAELDRVRTMAEAAAFSASATAQRVDGGREPYKGAVWLLVIFMLIAAGGALFALITRDSEELRPEIERPTNWTSEPPAGRAPAGP